MRASMLLTSMLVASCAGRKVPEHLRVTPTEQEETLAPPTSLSLAVEQLLAGDPLLRRPVPRTAAWWMGLPEPAPLSAWHQTVATGAVSIAALDTLEANWPGTIAIPLARGARLAELEVALPTAPPDEQGDRSLVIWLGALTVRPVPGRSDVRPPLGWIADNRVEQRQGLVSLVERAVLAGWLENPDTPLGPVAKAMEAAAFDRLRTSPEGGLIHARATSATDEARAARGWNDLQDATHLALVQAAADGIRSQRDAQELSRAIAQAHGQPEETNPLPTLLSDALDAFTADGGNPRSLGHALVSLAALRMDRRCGHPPCTGLDRIALLHLAGRQSEGVLPTAWAWRLVAAKRAADRVAVSIEQELPTSVFPTVADIIVGETGRRVPLSLLLQRSVGPEASLAITRGLGAPDGTSPEDALRSLEDHIANVCAEQPPSLPAMWSAPVQRICAQG